MELNRLGHIPQSRVANSAFLTTSLLLANHQSSSDHPKSNSRLEEKNATEPEKKLEKCNAYDLS